MIKYNLEYNLFFEFLLYGSGEFMESQSVKKKNKSLITALMIVGIIFFTIVVSSIALVVSVTNNYKSQGFVNLFGKGIISVESNSMKGNYDDSFEKGDVLLIDLFDKNDYDKLEEGLVVTFYDKNILIINYKRIVHIERDDNGDIVYVAVQGDYSADLFGVYDPTTLTGEELINRREVVLLTVNDIKGIVIDIVRD